MAVPNVLANACTNLAARCQAFELAAHDMTCIDTRKQPHAKLARSCEGELPFFEGFFSGYVSKFVKHILHWLCSL